MTLVSQAIRQGLYSGFDSEEVITLNKPLAYPNPTMLLSVGGLSDGWNHVETGNGAVSWDIPPEDYVVKEVQGNTWRAEYDNIFYTDPRFLNQIKRYSMTWDAAFGGSQFKFFVENIEDTTGAKISFSNITVRMSVSKPGFANSVVPLVVSNIQLSGGPILDGGGLPYSSDANCITCRDRTLPIHYCGTFATEPAESPNFIMPAGIINGTASCARRFTGTYWITSLTATWSEGSYWPNNLPPYP